mmetsp:Transcript_9453/g.40142  ORF Transcript_9453/g.40142 Transcript_9453/m.40142 type:complete len:248 (+) Transcript_9453:211-954(+)
MVSMLLMMPCDPIPESRTPWNGKWSGPRAGGPLICTVPVSIKSATRIASSTFFVNTHPCRPYLLSLTNRKASSSVFTRTTGTTGPKGSSHAKRISLVTWSTKHGHTRLSSLRHGCFNTAPFFTASSTKPCTKSAEAFETNAVMSAFSSGRPTRNASIILETDSTKGSAIASNAKTSFTAVHRCPEYENPPFATALAARCTSASGNTRHASFPPNSIWIGTMFAFFATDNPVSPPVKEIKFAPGCEVR